MVEVDNRGPLTVEAIELWRTGRAEAAGYDELIARARRRFAGWPRPQPAPSALTGRLLDSQRTM